MNAKELRKWLAANGCTFETKKWWFGPFDREARR